mmetsp:Transcript_48020/g.88408  ORF Transcript_48020/g.88408 Transcript_48020/m.88408 type:complete len:725 (+) Transcript_48020:52-2226(+)
MPQPVRAFRRSNSTGMLVGSSPASSERSSPPAASGHTSETGGCSLAGRPLGPKPLVRFGSDRQLQLQPEGLALLRRAAPPVHVVFAIGGSRCGKSTTGNALIFDERSEADGFTTGGSFEPVTTGVDIATRALRDGGTLVVGDCEGAFHICGSEQSARGFGALGLMAYNLSSNLLHVSMGSIDERDIEALGYLAAYADGSQQTQGFSPRHGLGPSLVLLVNGTRFDLGDEVAQRLFRPPEGTADGSGRWCSRAAISKGFHGPPALEALPACEHAAYWPCVEALRQRMLERSPALLPSGAQATGADLVEKLVQLVGSLNSEVGGQALLEPQPATQELCRHMHLEPLTEEIAKKFAALGPEVDLQEQLQEALLEFDRRTAWLTSQRAEGNSDHPDGRADALVLETRSRLASRLSGITEALERGRLQGLSTRRWQTPTNKQQGRGKENMAPSTPGTPRKRNLKKLDALVAEECGRAQAACKEATQMVEELQAAVEEAGDKLSQFLKTYAGREEQSETQIVELHRNLSLLLAETIEGRKKGGSDIAALASEAIAEMQNELESIMDGCPDPVGTCAAQLNELRTELEGERFRRHEAGNAAASAIDVDLRSLREDVEKEWTCMTSFRDLTMSRFSEMVAGLERNLKDERCQRQDRHNALAEVVERFRASVEATTEQDAQGDSILTEDHVPSSSSEPRRLRSMNWERSMEGRLRAALMRQAESPRRARKIFA